MEDPEYQSHRSTAIPRSEREEPAYFTRRAPDLARCRIFIPDHNPAPPDVLAFIASEEPHHER